MAYLEEHPHYYDDIDSHGSCIESMIVVSAPGLTSFKLKGHALPVFSAASLPCLHNVHVCLKTWSFDEYESYDVPDEENLQRMPLNVMKMLEQLGEADYVTLSMDTVKGEGGSIWLDDLTGVCWEEA